MIFLYSIKTMTQHVRQHRSGDIVVQKYMKPRLHQRDKKSYAGDLDSLDDPDLADLPRIDDDHDHACVVSSAVTLMLEARLAFSEVRSYLSNLSYTFPCLLVKVIASVHYTHGGYSNNIHVMFMFMLFKTCYICFSAGLFFACWT